MQNSWSTGIPQGPPPGMGQQGGSGGGGHWGGGGGGRSRGGMGGGHARNRVFGGVQFQQGGHGGGGGYMQQSRMRKPNGYDEVSMEQIWRNCSKSSHVDIFVDHDSMRALIRTGTFRVT